MPILNLMVEHAKELICAPDGWDGYEFEAIGRTAKSDAKLFKVKGAVAPLISKGKNKGRPNWRKFDKATVQEAFFTPDEHSAWLSEWEDKTGKCSRCAGTGQTLSGWSVASGARFRECDKCGGTGKK